MSALLLLSLGISLVAATDPVPVDGAGAPVKRFEIMLKAMTDEEHQQLDRHLADLVGKPLTPELIQRATARLASIRRYAKAQCTSASDAVVVCTVTRARVLSEVHVEGLPPALLESDVMKRVFLKPGEPLDEDDTSGKSRLTRQKQRIEELLEREGFVGAEVKLLVKKAHLAGEFNVVVRVRGGSFVRVRRVLLGGYAPLSQRELTDSYARMCLTSEGLLDGAFIGNLTSCFNKRRLQATTDRFTQRLRGLGYPEARIHVQATFVDPAHSDTPDCALPVAEMEAMKKTGLKPPAQCVDLHVDVLAGTLVTTRFHLEAEGERHISDNPDLLGSSWLWLRETFAEPVSRLLQVLAHGPAADALDTQLVEGRLVERLSFEQAGSADDTELDVSARNLEGYLAERGRIAPHIDVERTDYPGQRVIEFHVAASPLAAVRSVRFVGNRHLSAADISEGTELAAHLRSFSNSGAISPELLADDEERIRTVYANHGYPEANVQAVAELTPPTDIDVTFVIDEGDAFVLSGVVLAGGAPTLTSAVLGAIKHCDGGVATHEKRKPLTPDDCKGAPLRPDELEADQQRVQQVYASHGFANVDVHVETAFDSTGTQVRITVVPPTASEAEQVAAVPDNVKQVKLGEVFLEGAALTRRDVLLREAGLDDKAGQPLDPIMLGKGISRLRRSGLYDSVEVQYLGLDGSYGGDRAALRLSVDERPAFTVDTSIGYSTEKSLTLGAEVRHKNVFGTMLDADLIFDFGLFVGRFSDTRTQLRWPRIFGTDVSFSVVPIALSYSDQAAGSRLARPSTTAGQNARASWDSPDLRRRLFSIGGSLSLDWRLHDIAEILDDKLSLGVSIELRYDYLKTAGRPVAPFSVDAFETIDGLLPTISGKEGPNRVATLTPRISYNNVDNPFDPREGFGVDVFVRGSSPPFVLHGPYGVFGAAGRAYHTLWDRLTFAAGGRTRIGASTNVVCPDNQTGCEWALMQTDLLQLGGERSVRGVDENQIGVFSPTFNSNLQSVTVGGAQVSQLRPGLYGFEGNLELRYALIKEFFIGSLEPAVFADAGLSTDDFNFQLQAASDQPDLRAAWSVGTGIRLVTPVGPLSADIAYSPPRRSLHWYLTLGYVF